MAALAAATSSLLATFRPPKDAASNGGCRGCHGVAPSGARWAYMMPQHVGVNAVVYFLGDDADGLTRTCMRGHFYEGCGATFAFTFVANPYRRVLSAAALQKVIRPPGGVVGPSTAPKAGEVAKFRGWVAKLRWNRFYVAPQVDFTRAFNGTSAQYVGRATDVVGGMRHVLASLGYDKLEERLTQFAAHATTDMKNAGGFVAPAGEGVFTEWYDDETASKVQQRYHADFRAFNYSKDWRRMWE